MEVSLRDAACSMGKIGAGRLTTESNIRHLIAVIDGGPQTAVVISKTLPGFEPCSSWMVCSYFIYTPISYSSNTNLLYIFRVKWYGSLHHPPTTDAHFICKNNARYIRS